jgi:hypothetical protein
MKDLLSTAMMNTEGVTIAAKIVTRDMTMEGITDGINIMEMATAAAITKADK